MIKKEKNMLCIHCKKEEKVEGKHACATCIDKAEALRRPIARTGEPIYASIVRNRSGMDSGDIDYGCRVASIEALCDGDKQDIADTAYALYKTICHYSGKTARQEKQ